MKPPKNRRKKRRARLILGLTLAALVITGAGIGAARLYPFATAQMDMTLLEASRACEPSVLLAYDPAKRGERSGELHPVECAVPPTGRPRMYVSYGDMPDDLRNAFIAIEDKRFYRHAGVDWIRTAKAGLGYLLDDPTCGGSTITQQLVKNLTGRAEQTAERTLTEIFTALDLEKQMDKDRILEAYLNVINLSEGCFGVGAAADTYFQKKVGELTLTECAAIAAITNNPARYDPITHPEANRSRRELILRVMAEQGYITEAERAEAVNTPLTLQVKPKPEPVAATSWYADMVISDVIRDLTERLGYTYSAASLLVYRGGLRIETAMDETLQGTVEAYYADLNHFPEGDSGRPQSSFILIDPRNGDILAVAGAVGKKTASRLQSYATDTRRPAGSCIKPLSVYAPALEKGLITWASLYEDEPVGEMQGRLWPANADGLYRGRVTVGRAVAQSLNPVAVRILEELGVEASFSFARREMGLYSLIPPDESGLHDCTVSSLALGQQSVGITSRELTAAYTALYGGIRREAVSYHRVLDREGHVLLENTQTERRVLSAETAAVLTRLLVAVNEEGTAAKYLQKMPALGMETGGKTGTTQGGCDRRYIGMTPRLLAGVWMGYDYPAELKGVSGNPCVTVWDELTAACEQIYVGAPSRGRFPLPDGVFEAEICPLSGNLPCPYCTDPLYGCPTERGWFVRGAGPLGVCTLHREPPIRIVPEDPADPDRIPLLPEDILPEETSDDTRTRDPEREAFPWFSRWFSRFSYRGRRES